MPTIAAFVGPRLRRARIARMKTGVALAEEVGVTPSAISHFEKGNSDPSDSIVRRMAMALGVPPIHFFHPLPPNPSHTMRMRSMSSATKRARDSADVRVDWLREIATYLCDVMPMPAVDLPDLCAETDPLRISDESIEDCATRLRRAWGMRDGPIENLTDLLESKGFVVSRFSLGAETLHAFSKWAPDLPVIVKNTDVMTPVRMRFDLAHELGHMVMHRHVPDALAGRPEMHKLMESQAHRFAGAFVFPARSFVNEIYSISIHGLLEPKRRWKLSVQTMIRRARDLRLISEDQYDRAFRTVSAKGYRKREPLDDTMEAEVPKQASERVRQLVEDRGFTVDEIEMQTRHGRREIEALCSLPMNYFDRPTDPKPDARKVFSLERAKRRIEF